MDAIRFRIYRDIATENENRYFYIHMQAIIYYLFSI